MPGLAQLLGREIMIGVDIGSCWIKIAQAEETGKGRWRVCRAAIGPTPANTIREGIITDPAAIGSALRDLMKKNGFDATGAAAAINGSNVIVRHVKMPVMSEAALRRSVRYEASKYISSSVDDSQIEFEITGPIPGEEGSMGVMLVAAPNGMVDSRLDALHAAGLTALMIDIEPFALQRALLDLPATRPGEGSTLALVDIGASCTDINIICNGHFALTRNIDYAGEHFTQALQPLAPTASRDELEQMKMQVDMSALLSQDADLQTQAMARAVQPVFDELLREVKRSINYYQSQLTEASSSTLPPDVVAHGGGNTAVTKIVVTGGSAKMAGLEGYMSARLGIEVETWNVADNPDIDMTSLSPSFIKEYSPFLTTAIGLALKEHVENAAAKSPVAKAA